MSDEADIFILYPEELVRSLAKDLRDIISPLTEQKPPLVYAVSTFPRTAL
jgi:hypothetical protein